MKLGLVEWLIRGASDRETFLAAQRLGVDGVEVVVGHEHLAPPRAGRLARLAAAKAETGIEIPSLFLGEQIHGGIASPDPAVAGRAQSDALTAIEWAAELGARVILLPFFFASDLVTEADVDRAVQAFRAVCPPAHEAGIAIGFEGTLPAPEVRRLAAAVDSVGFGCYFDLANAVWLGHDTATEIRRLGKLIVQVHMKDMLDEPTGCPPGLGRVDFAASARALTEIGFDGWIVLETPAGPPDVVARDIGFTRSVFPALRRPPDGERVAVDATGAVTPLDRPPEVPASAALRGQVALVTGAAGGLGSALVRSLARHGAVVVACDVDDEGLQRVKDAAHGDGAGAVHPRHLDLADPEEIQRSVAVITAEHGDIDLLIHAAVRHFPGAVGKEARPFVEHSPAQVLETLAVAVTGPTLLTQLVCQRMVERRRGRIVLTGSMQRHGAAGIVMYAAAKAYVNALARGLFLELREYGIVASVANPGGMNTGLHWHRHGWMLDPAVVAETIVQQLTLPSNVAVLSFEIVPHDPAHPDAI